MGFEPTEGYKPSPVFKTGALNQLDHLSMALRYAVFAPICPLILLIIRPIVNGNIRRGKGRQDSTQDTITLGKQLTTYEIWQAVFSNVVTRSLLLENDRNTA